MGIDEVTSGEDTNMQLQRSMQEPQCDMSYSSVASQLAGRTPKLSVFSGDSIQKGEVSFKQWVFKVKRVMQSHTEATLREWIVHSLQAPWQTWSDT